MSGWHLGRWRDPWSLSLSWKGAEDLEGLSEHREGGGPGIPDRRQYIGRRGNEKSVLRKQVCKLLVLF